MTFPKPEKIRRKDGIVKWYDKSWEFGFLTTEGVDRDVFFHRKDICQDTPEHELTHPGTPVSFLFKWGEKGPRALDVNALSIEVRGELKWYDSVKEYGFVISDDVDQDIFFHRRDIGDCTTESDLNQPGTPVSFSFNWDDKGPRALDVNAISGDE